MNNLTHHAPTPSFKLMVFELDCEKITLECLNAAIQNQGLHKELEEIKGSFVGSDLMRKKLALLKGVSVGELEKHYNHHLRLDTELQTVISACKKMGIYTLLLSNADDMVVNHFKNLYNIDLKYSSVFDKIQSSPLETHVLTGQIVPQVWGDMWCLTKRKNLVLDLASLMNIEKSQILMLAQSQSDLDMLDIAGYSLTYKPCWSIKNRVDYHALTAQEAIDKIQEKNQASK